MPDRSALRPFGKTGLEVSALCIGTSSWGTERSGESAAQRDARIGSLADFALSAGSPVNCLDTSNIYGGSRSEGYIGQALARAGGVPAGYVIHTKLDRRLSDNAFTEEQMWRSLEESRERLGLERIQVLFLHDPEVIGFERATAPGGPMAALLEMKERGLADAIGISGGPVDMLRRFVATGHFDALITHNRFTLVDRSADELLSEAHERGLGINNAAPYGAGALHTGGDPLRYGYGPAHPEVSAAVLAMRRVCAEAGVDIGAAALQFSLREPRISSTVVGISSLERLDRTLMDATADIPEGLWAELDELAPSRASALDAR